MGTTCVIPPNLSGKQCVESFLREALKFAFVPDGTNEIEYATVESLTSEEVITDINDDNPVKRMLILEDIENYNPEMGESKVEEFNSGNSVQIANGMLTYNGIISTGDPILAENIMKLNNLRLRVIPIGVNGFVYETDSATKLKVRGFKIARGSFKARFIPSNGNDISEKVEFSFKIDRTTDWSLYRFVTYDVLGFNFAEVVEPLIPIDIATVSDATADGFTVSIQDERGNPITGLGTDFVEIYNVTTDASVTGVAAESTSNIGTYTVATATGVTAADELTVTFSADGIDSYGVSESVTVGS